MKLKKNTGIRKSNPREELLDEELISRAVCECLEKGDSAGVIEVTRAYLKAINTSKLPTSSSLTDPQSTSAHSE